MCGGFTLNWIWAKCPQLAGSLIFCLVYPQFGTNVFFFPCPFRSHGPGYILGGGLYWWEVDWPLSRVAMGEDGLSVQRANEETRTFQNKRLSISLWSAHRLRWLWEMFLFRFFQNLCLWALLSRCIQESVFLFTTPITTVLISSPITSSLDYHSWLDTSLLWLSLPPPPHQSIPSTSASVILFC